MLITKQSGKVAFGADPASTSVHTASVSEGAGTLKVPISIDVPPGRAAAIAVAVRAGGTAVENTDFTIPVKTFTFTPTGGTARTVTVELTDDLAIERDETIELEIVPNVPGGLEGTGPRALGENYVRHASGARATITVQDNDAAPGAPTGLALTPLDGGLALAWRAPALATVTGYDVHYTTARATGARPVADGAAVQGGSRPSAANGWVDAGHRGTRPSHSIANLTNGTPVRVRVRAVNTGGGGTWAHATETPRIRTWSFSPFQYNIPSGVDAEVSIVLTEPAPPGGVAFALTTRLGLDIPAGLCGGDAEGAVEADLGATLPTMLTVPAGRQEGKASFPTANNDDLAGSPAECFVVMASTAAPGWSASGSSSAEVTIGRHGTVTFGNNALNTRTYTASVAEDVSGGTLNVPVTVNRLPVRSTTIAVEVVAARTTATEYANDDSPGDFRIAAKSLTFGPDASRTQNLRVAITDDEDVEDDEFIELKFATQSRSLYPELFNVARITIVDDELSAPTDLEVEAGDAKLDVSWTAPTATVTAYDVHYTSAPASGDDSVADDAAVQTGPSPLARAGWVDAGHTGTDPEHEITSLDNGTTYRVRVRARNDEADSAWATQSGTPKSADATLRALTGSTSTDGRDFSGTLDIATSRRGHDGLHGDGGRQRHAREADPDGQPVRRHGDGGQAGHHPGDGGDRFGERRHRAGRGRHRHRGGGHRAGRQHADLRRDGEHHDHDLCAHPGGHGGRRGERRAHRDAGRGRAHGRAGARRRLRLLRQRRGGRHRHDAVHGEGVREHQDRDADDPAGVRRPGGGRGRRSPRRCPRRSPAGARRPPARSRRSRSRTRTRTTRRSRSAPTRRRR